MVLQFHGKDWLKLDNEDQFLKAARECNLKPGNYTFPGCKTPEERNSAEFKKKMEAGPHGVMTVFSHTGMAQNLALTFLYFLVVNFCLAYLAGMVLHRGADYMPVFRFMSTATFLVYLAGIVPHAIWFRCRIVGHIIDSLLYAVIVGVIFMAMWPGVSS